MMETETTLDKILGGRVLLRQLAKGYRVAIDPVLLAAYVPAVPGQSVCEFGCGTGAALLCLAARVGDLDLAALERDALMRDLATENVAQNGREIALYTGAIGGEWVLPEAVFDHVFFNPPFYDAAGYDESPHGNRTEAHQLDVPLPLWLKAARRALKPDGTVTMIIATGQLMEAMEGLSTGFGAVEIVPVRARPQKDALRLLIRARMGRKTRPVLSPALILHDDNGDYTPAALGILSGALPLI